WRGAFLEGLGAIAALQQEAPAFGRVREQLAQREDFPRGDQRRQLGELRKRSGQFGGIRADRLLELRMFLPRCGAPTGRFTDGTDGGLLRVHADSMLHCGKQDATKRGASESRAAVRCAGATRSTGHQGRAARSRSGSSPASKGRGTTSSPANSPPSR